MIAYMVTLTFLMGLCEYVYSLYQSGGGGGGEGGGWQARGGLALLTMGLYVLILCSIVFGCIKMEEYQTSCTRCGPWIKIGLPCLFPKTGGKELNFSCSKGLDS